jgi:hypothetical protein
MLLLLLLLLLMTMTMMMAMVVMVLILVGMPMMLLLVALLLLLLLLLLIIMFLASAPVVLLTHHVHAFLPLSTASAVAHGLRASGCADHPCNHSIQVCVKLFHLLRYIGGNRGSAEHQWLQAFNNTLNYRNNRIIDVRQT